MNSVLSLGKQHLFYECLGIPNVPFLILLTRKRYLIRVCFHPGIKCGVGSMALGLWCSVSFASTSSNTIHLLLSDWIYSVDIKEKEFAGAFVVASLKQ